MKKRTFSYFRLTTRLLLFVFAAAILALFAGDIAYVDGPSMWQTLTSASVLHALFLSLACSLAATALAVIVAVPSGYALSRYPFRGMIFVDVIIDALIVLPVLVIGISILVAFRQGMDLAPVGRELLVGGRFAAENGGLFDRICFAFVALAGYALLLAGETTTWLADFFVHEVPGIVLAMFFCSASYAVRVMKATFDNLDPRTEQVAMTLGCTRAGAFWRVTLPLSRQGLIAAAVLSWARAVGVYGPVMIVAGAVEGKTHVLPTSIYVEISNGQLKSALAISIMMIVMAFAVLLVLKRFSRTSLFGAGGTG